jgi:hypothetical protein
MVALMLPLFFILLVFAVDASNSWIHKRHLQGQVDAGVFAGALGPWWPTCDNSAIEQSARSYGGDESATDPSSGASNKLSALTGNRGTVHLLINSTKYYNEPGAGDYTDGGTPCESFLANNGHLDLKVTESNQPTFFGSIFPGLNFVPAINAHARVELQELSSTSGLLPVGLPDPNPVDGAVFFINEDAPLAPLAVAKLTKAPTNPVTLNGQGVIEWDTAPTTIVPFTKTGVVVAFSGSAGWTTVGTLDVVCNQPLVECYQGEDVGPYLGLSFIHGSDLGGGTPASPALGDVQVDPLSCVDDSAPYFLVHGCTVGFKAKINFGGATNIAVAVDGPGCPNGNPRGCPLTLNGGYYTAQGTQPTIPTGGGPYPLTINWNDRDLILNRNFSGSFSAQRVYSADDDPALSGPIEYVKVVDPSSGAAKNSVPTGSPTDVAVRVGIQGNVETQSEVADPAVKLRVVGGSRNQSLDCDSNPPIAHDDPGYTTLSDELAYGCWPQYTPNTGTACPRTASLLWQPQPPAWNCVALQTGTAKNQVPKGMNTRVLGTDKPTTCPPLGALGHNNWKYDPDGDGVPNLPVGDPRVLLVFVTPFGSFTGSGSGTVPVVNFATFYVTGWSGSGAGFDNPCTGNGDDPVPGPAYIVGHFMHYGFDTGSGTGTGGGCIVSDPTVLTPCVAVLTQ